MVRRSELLSCDFIEAEKDDVENTRLSKLEITCEEMQKTLVQISRQLKELNAKLEYNEEVDNKVIIPINTDLNELNSKLSEDKVFAHRSVRK